MGYFSGPVYPKQYPFSVYYLGVARRFTRKYWFTVDADINALLGAKKGITQGRKPTSHLTTRRLNHETKRETLSYDALGLLCGRIGHIPRNVEYYIVAHRGSVVYRGPVAWRIYPEMERNFRGCPGKSSFYAGFDV